MTSKSAEDSSKNVKWDMQKDSMFIHHMSIQNDLGLCEKGGFTAEAWRALERLMCADFGNDYKKDKLKNRLKGMKATYGIIKEIMNLSGFGWDDQTNRVTAEPAVWEEYLTTHPKRRMYRDKQLIDYCKLAMIFGDGTADGRGGYATNDDDSEVPIRATNPNTPQVDDGDNDFFDANITVESGFPVEPDSPAFAASSKEAGPSVQKFTPVRRKKGSSASLERAADVVAKAILEMAQKQSTRPDIPSCIAVIGELGLEPEWKYKAYKLMENDMKATIFMSLPIEERLWWLQIELGYNG